MYSILEDEWIKRPRHTIPDIDNSAITAKVHDLVVQIDHAIDSADDAEDLKRITDKLRRMRRSGLDSGGEFSVENLTFKTLRNMGYIKRLHDGYLHRQDQQLSM